MKSILSIPIFIIGFHGVLFCQCQEMERQTGYELNTNCGSSIKYLNFIPISYDWTLSSSGTFEFPHLKDMLRGIAKLNENLNEHNIYVHLPEIHESIFQYNTNSLSVFPTIINNLGLEKAIFGFFRSRGSFQGNAFSIPNNYFSVTGVNSSLNDHQFGIVSHELGHALGLFHTFYQPGVGSEEMELSDGSNCAIAGDYICDTPADHLSLIDMVSSETCIFSPPSMWHTDIIDPPLSPDVSNLMSYYPHKCKNSFTEEQGLAMHCVLVNSAAYMGGQVVTSERQSITITTNITYDGPEDIFGDIIIKDGGTLNINSKVRMPFFGKIIVEPGGRLFINDGGHVTSYTQGQYWQGITAIGVESGNNFPRVILNHGTIENARVAVNGVNRILLLADNQFTFLNNKIGIKLSSHQGTNLSSIKNCIFKTDNDLFDVAWDVPLMDETLDTIRGQSNQSAGHRYFIHLHNFSNIPIINNIFESELSITADYEGEAIHLEKSHCLIRGNTFTNQRNAVSIYDDYTKFGTSRIIDNTFNDNLTAIRIEGSNLVKIEENSINIGALTLGSDYNFGVRIIGSSGIQVLNNEFSSDFNSNVFFIAANDTNDALASEFKYNSFGSKGKVAYRAIELQGDHRMLQMFCNDFTMTSDVEFAIGLENGTLLMNQGLETAPAGNDWSNIGSCNDESQIYKAVTASDFLYHAYANTSPDCVSNGVDVQMDPLNQPLTHCQIPSDPDCGGPFPRICDLAVLAEIQDTIRSLIDNPIFSKPQKEREAEIRYFEHQLLSIVQSNIIDKISEDSIDEVLIYLNSIKSFSPALGDIHDAILDKYTEPLLRPTTTNDYSYFHNLSTFIPRSTIPNKFVPLSKEVNNIHEKETEKKIDTKDVEIQIYPNPTDGQTVIRLINGEKYNVSLKSISIYNAIGQQVLYTGTHHTQSFQFDVTRFKSGLYFIQVEDSNNRSHVKKLITKH